MAAAWATRLYRQNALAFISCETMYNLWLQVPWTEREINNRTPMIGAVFFCIVVTLNGILFYISNIDF